jgi:hypothetical protein
MLLHAYAKQRCNRRRRLLGAVVACCLAALASGAQAMNGGGANAVASKFAGMHTIFWNGLEIGLWSVPGYGVHAYKVTYPPGYAGPTTLSEGWHYCANQGGYARSFEECIGTAQPPAR